MSESPQLMSHDATIDRKTAKGFPPGQTYDWVVLIQTQAPGFQRMVERLSQDVGRCLIVTGTPFEPQFPTVDLSTSPAYDRQGLWRRAVSWIHFSLTALRTLGGLEGRPFVLAVTNPPLACQVAWAASRLFGYPYALLVWDVYPDAAVKAGIIAGDHFLVRAWRALNRMALQEARAIITIGDVLADTLRRQLRDPHARIDVIPNWADTDWLRPIPKAQNRLALEYGQVDKMTVLYSGNISSPRGLALLVKASQLLEELEDLSFFVVGEGRGRREIEDEVDAARGTNVRLLPLVEWSDLPLLLAMGDIAVIAQEPGLEQVSFPSKTYSALAAGSAILALVPEDSDVARLVRTHDVGVVCASSDPGDVARVLRDLHDDQPRLQRYRANARRVAVSEFSETVICRQFSELLATRFGLTTAASSPRRSG